ncbi:3-deoxy-D-manno-octulosonic acid transferase [Gaetbulibacter saemankumensis]|uniref:3-deoxy-D-manno-octulosonic acid transferase n=1 Tax=Gaetbulibacter saemankumensis TaxID=311208 RepID=UPI000407F017|nr:glycosyltransferase N-terminal domain-containing protein [Gaetbulibacter saemankumensis]
MSFIYNIGIKLANLGLQAIAPFNDKIKRGVMGRKAAFSKLEKIVSANDKTLWFHCASLGEYEQGLPVFSGLRTYYRNHKIVLTFFSPSGYEIRKNSPIADVVIYLPIDSKRNARKFLDIVNPELTVFVKYDIWPNYLNELKSRQLPAILISAAFRPHQSYFKFYGSYLRKALFAFEHIFTQNKTSKALLNSIGYNNVTISGDTRFDRVSNQLNIDNTLDYIENFKQNKVCVVAGSTWPEGEALIARYINEHALDNVKFIIAPHNIKTNQIKQLKNSLEVETVLFSEKDNSKLSSAKVFIVDTIGILSKIYSYADIAYVGGALGNTGLHNTLEPAVFGMPIIIGNNYDKFPEASEMIANEGMFSISNQKEFNYVLNELIENSEKRRFSGNSNLNYIKSNKGAVTKILEYLNIPLTN